MGQGVQVETWNKIWVDDAEGVRRIECGNYRAKSFEGEMGSRRCRGGTEMRGCW